MCGIAGVIFREGYGPVGKVLVAMLSALQHRGFDSAGVAVYNCLGFGDGDTYIVRTLTADVLGALGKVASALGEIGANIRSVEMKPLHGVSFDRFVVKYRGDLRDLIDVINKTGVARVISIGRCVEIFKMTGKVGDLEESFNVSRLEGSHGIGHVRFSTESGVDLFRAHPFQSTINPDVTVVHNGQITNYWKMRAFLERQGVNFITDNDSELIVHYIAWLLEQGFSLEEALKRSVRDLDGPFAYIVATPDAIGIARDRLGLRPLIAAESVDGEVIIAASEEAALHAASKLLGVRFNTRYLRPGQVMVWRVRR
ncbi:glutamine amidotransferase class-II [Pyrolobus fumarii 1A]|uniref:Glutamine amidotransferase class-II n=1 Tax=Pyrolobus fumarii (strain DSM 11204 / 1A) TaxID=694429 RepID=G0EH77_PYRF1|nr:glutamine amidotransferase [Pyrolobus fumarii]AEM39301.1 glutamine amidotransferase class-II [Pyrolobus fumarii 1A]